MLNRTSVMAIAAAVMLALVGVVAPASAKSVRSFAPKILTQPTARFVSKTLRTIEAYEDALGDKTKSPDEAQTALRAIGYLTQAQKSLHAYMAKVKKTLRQKRYLEQAKTRLEWATHQLRKTRLAQRARVAGYLSEVLHNLVLSTMPCDPKPGP